MNDDTIESLIILQEECAEVIVEISKCFRFGPDQCMEGTNETNMQKLEKEIGDMMAMVDLLIKFKSGITNAGISKAKKKKIEKLKTWSRLNIK